MRVKMKQPKYKRVTKSSFAFSFKSFFIHKEALGSERKKLRRQNTKINKKRKKINQVLLTIRILIAMRQEIRRKRINIFKQSNISLMFRIFKMQHIIDVVQTMNEQSIAEKQKLLNCLRNLQEVKKTPTSYFRKEINFGSSCSSSEILQNNSKKQLVKKLKTKTVSKIRRKQLPEFSKCPSCLKWEQEKEKIKKVKNKSTLKNQQIVYTRKNDKLKKLSQKIIPKVSKRILWGGVFPTPLKN